MRLDWILTPIVIAIGFVVAFLIAKKYRKNPRKTLIRLVAANIFLDAFAIGVWAAFPTLQWTIYQLNFSIVGVEAAVAAALFCVTLFGLFKSKKWAPTLAIAVTVAQRVFATYVFFPSVGIALTLTWSLLIVFFAHSVLKQRAPNAPAPPQ